MRRFFARNLLFVVGINLLIKPVWVICIDRTVQNRVGHSAYGTYQALLNLAVIFQIVLDFGLNSYNTRTISQNPSLMRRQFPVLLTARLVLIGLYAALVMGIGLALGYRGGELTLLAGTLTIQALTILLLFIRSNVAALQRFRLDGLLSISDRTIMIIVCGFLLVYPATARAFRIEWFIGAQIGSYACALVLGFLLLRRIARVPLRFSFHFASVIHIIKQSAPYALLFFLMAIYMRSDTMLVERISAGGKEEAGIYAAASRLLDVGNMISLMFAGILLPLFGSMLAKKQDVSAIVRLCVNLLLPVSLLCAAVAWVAGTDVMHLLYHHAGAYDGLVFAFLMTAYPAYSLTYVYSTLLTANGRLAVLNKLVAAAAVINLALNFILIPRYGALGAGITACITQWAVALGFVVFAARINKLPVHRRWIGAHLAYVMLIAAAGLLLRMVHFSWPVEVGALLLFGLVLIFLFRFISIPALKQLLLNR